MTTMTPGAFFRDLFFESLREPRTAARRLFALDLPMQVRWLALLLVSVLTLIAANIMLSTVPVAEVQPWEQVWADAWTGLPIQVMSMTVFAFAIARIGALFGGTGGFADALLAVTWIQGVLLVPQGIQILLFPVAPFLASLIAIGSVVLFFWLLSQFICALHGFQNALTAFFGVLASLVVLVIVFAVVFAMLGILPAGPEG